MSATESAYMGKSLCAIFTGALIIGLLIAASTVDWYKNEEVFDFRIPSSADLPDGKDSLINSTKTFYDLQGFKVETKGIDLSFSLRTETLRTTFETYDEDSKVFEIMKVVQAFVLVSLLSTLVCTTILCAFLFERIRLKALYALKNNTRLLVLIFAILAFIASLIAFLSFLGIQDAFDEDIDVCDEGPCKRLVDHIETSSKIPTPENADTTETEVTQFHTRDWRPVAGWYLTLATIPLALVLIVVILINQFPMPLNSDSSSGEAL